MARPYDPGPEQFVFAAGDGNDHQVSVNDPQEAFVAFSAFFRDRNSDTYTIGDGPALESLVLMPGQGVIARVAGANRPRSAIEEVGRLWEASGIVDPSGQYCVFFDSHDADDDQAERAELLKPIEFLGIERVDAPAEAAGGEVWVGTDTRLDAECARWS